MTSKERVEKLLAGEPIDRVPFEPAIYEHKAFLIGKTPSEVAQSEELLLQSLRKEHEIYGADFLVVGLDVYNVEAEALGCSVRFFENADVPAISEPILESPEEVERLKLPNPETDGRMPLFLSAAEKLAGERGEDVVIRGALSGPFSLASELLGMEKLLIETFSNPESVTKLLNFATDVLIAYADAFLDRGVGIVSFDSRCAPPLISPDMYRETVFPFHRKLMMHLKERGETVRALIIGGDTLPLNPFLKDTGANILLADFTVDLEEAFQTVAGSQVVLRANLDPFVLSQGRPEEIETAARNVVAAGLQHRRFMMGTGIVPYDTPPEKVQIVKKIVETEGKWT
ncbi:MAG: hypothetical protein GXO76_14805 [Calditrichaeota bacterium]|nr:hypothetical protein [Calditrichota bacterium]